MPPKQRATGLKVKTGCITCKIRRVKCDEAKPSCNRCTSTGRKCDGYAPQEGSRAVVPSASGIHRIWFDMPGTPAERRGFHYFRDRTAPELAGYFTEGFWDSKLLQRTMSSQVLRHAIIAFGALHEKFASGQLDVAPQEGSYLFAMQQYSRAVVELRKSLQSGDLPPEVVLMASLVFTSFENLRGNYDTALLHLRSGLSVLRDCSNDPKHSHAERILVEMNIRPLFIRLGMQAIIFADAKAPQNLISIWADVVGTALRNPDDFTNLNEARFALETYVDSMTEFFYISQPLATRLPHADQVIQKQCRHMEYIRRWGEAFDAFVLKTGSTFTGKDLRAATLLKIQHLTAVIMVGSSLNREPTFENFTSEFKTLIDLATSLVAAESKNNITTFSPEMGVIPSLYFTSIKCRVPAIRAEALRLLLVTPRREGMWDYSSKSQRAQIMIDLEKAEMDIEDEISLDQLRPDFHALGQDYDTGMAIRLGPNTQPQLAQPSHFPIYNSGEGLRSCRGGLLP